MSTNTYFIKIGDLGLSEKLYTKAYYREDDKDIAMPIKWMAMESLQILTFPEKTNMVRKFIDLEHESGM